MPNHTVPVHEIKADPNASLRTKNRIKEHGPGFLIDVRSSSVPCLENKQGVLVESIATWWTGWLPVDELKFLTVTNLKQVNKETVNG